MRSVNNCASDLYHEILKILHNDTIIHNPAYKQLSPLLKWKQENLMEQLNKLCEYIGPIENNTESSTVKKKDADDDEIESEGIISNNCSTSR